MLRSITMWGVSLFFIVGLFSILYYRANKETPEPRKIYKYTEPTRRNISHIVDKPKVKADEGFKETDDNSELSDVNDLIQTEISESEIESQVELNTTSNTETEYINTPEVEERYFGLTLKEIKQEIPILENEIHTNLTKAVKLYSDLSSTDGLGGLSPEIATWRDDTWKEVKRLFHDECSMKVMRYTSFIKVVGEEPNPLLRGGWIYELIEPLPMKFSAGGSTN